MLLTYAGHFLLSKPKALYSDFVTGLAAGAGFTEAVVVLASFFTQQEAPEAAISLEHLACISVVQAFLVFLPPFSPSVAEAVPT
jgi:hypothetical protein